MTKQELPKIINSPLSGDKLELMDKKFTNDEELSVAQFYDCSTEWFDDVVMYRNNNTNEIIYVPVERIEAFI